MEHSLENSTPKVALQFCVLDEELLNDQRLLASIRDLGASYFLFCQEALHAASRKRTDKRIIFLAANFEGRNFRKTKAITSQIIGPPALLDFHASHVALAEVSLSKTIIPVLKRPLYNRVLENVVAVVDGFSDTETSRLIKQIHHMGGFVMKTLTSASIGRHRPTHLIAYSALCKSYHVAVDNDMTITTEDWISELWLRRDERNLHRSHLITPQYACLRHIGIALIGFHSSERQHWRTAIESAAGVVHTDVSSSTNIVVLNDARHNFLCKLRRCSQGKRFLDAIFDREEVHFRLADEQSVVSCEFLARSLSDNICGPVRQYSLVVRDAESGYISSGQKRRCLHDHEDHPDQALPTPKRRVGTLCAETLCEDDDMPLTETPSRRLQTLALCSPGSSQQLSTRAVQRRPVRLSECDENEPASFTVGRGMCQRRQRATELLHTERNYVRLLRSLLENVVGPLEAEGSLEKAGLVALHDLDIIFGKLPIICRIHEKIASELGAAIDPWTDECEMGVIYAKFADDIGRVYPAYFSSYEESRRFLQDSMKQKPKLNAFINRCLSLPEFGRQSLADILIRPVQRLPTVLLLLKDLQKHTEDANPDYAGLVMAIASLENVLNLTNNGGPSTSAEYMGGSVSQLFPNVSGSHSSLSAAQFGAFSPMLTRKNPGGKRHSVDGGLLPDSTSLKAWEKARKLAFRTSSRVSRVFTFGAASGSGLKRAASTLLVNPAKNAKNLPEPAEEK